MGFLGFKVNNKIKKNLYTAYFPLAWVKNQSTSKLIFSFANFLSSSSVLFNIAPMHTRNMLHKFIVTIFLLSLLKFLSNYIFIIPFKIFEVVILS